MASLRVRLLSAMLLLLVGSCRKSPPELSITDAWLRPFLDNGAVFMTINNTGGRTDHLTSVECACATSLSLHVTEVDGEIARMIEVERVPLPGFAQTTLGPEGSHVMLAGLDRSLGAGDTVTLLLHFERTGDIEVTAEVRPLSAEP